MSQNPADPLEFLRKLWAPFGVPMPGMVFPGTSTSEIDKRIGDLKSVESWLSLNLEMIRTTIQGLEAQKATLAAFQSMQASAPSTDAAPKPEVPPPARRKRRAG